MSIGIFLQSYGKDGCRYYKNRKIKLKGVLLLNGSAKIVKNKLSLRNFLFRYENFCFILIKIVLLRRN